MRRYWVERRDLQGEEVFFQGDVFHHVFGVCRQGQGSKFEVLTEDGQARFVEVIAVGKKDARARVLETRPLPPVIEPRIHLATCLPRFPVFEAVLEKAVELGVESIQPLFSDFSFLRDPSSLSSNKTERWQKIIRSAMQQSGRGSWLRLEPARPLDDYLRDSSQLMNRNPNHRCLFAYEGDSTRGLREELLSWRNPAPRDITVFVGGEGGFSDREVRLFRNAGLHEVTLGSQVLRVETACMALVSVLKYEFDLMC